MGSSCTRVASIFVSDGKQARRTNSSSPLGELFDHGRDALASTFETMDFGSTAMCGGDSFWFWVILSIPFYGATWEHYFTNALILPIVNGPTEGLALIYGLHFMTAIVGAQWWAQPFQQSIPFLSWIPYVNAHKYGQAIDLYTQAIELNSQNVVYWANRSLAHTKLEEYGSAIQDATKAIDC
ncbi:hypothetical protein PVK06_021200 [Gossypium arboreum]|uniref:Uncharacterized protein n=1 Tax=Gossypium arboreum TaxID=29729 RepID=A0ABR0PPB8_GOSAR|nr:hypothetical protein PVK06_021200 [Gossypium arboreum]